MIKRSVNGTWMCSYSARHPITRQPMTRRRIGFKSKTEAQRVYNKLVVEVEETLKKEVVPNWISLVEEFRDDFFNRDVSKKTVDTYYLCLKAHTFECWGDLLVSDIKATDIRLLLREKLATKSISHQKSMYKFLRAVFRFAVEKGYINSSPVPHMTFRINSKLKTVLNEEQIAQLLAQAKGVGTEWYSVWATALYTGMRSGELYALTWDKIDFSSNRILVNCSWNNIDGFKDTKSGDDRFVEIAEGLKPILVELEQEREGSQFVLPRLEKWKKGEQARELRMFLEGMGLPRIRFHDLRASWATLLIAKGIPPIKVMMTGGWKDLKTLRIYVNKAGVDIVGTTKSLNFSENCM